MAEYCRAFGVAMKEADQLGDQLGGILPYKQAILVSQTRGSIVAVAISVHETSHKRRYAHRLVFLMVEGLEVLTTAAFTSVTAVAALR